MLSNIGGEALRIQKGDRIAQLVFAPTYRPVKIECVSALNDTDRGVGGLGSTGR